MGMGIRVTIVGVDELTRGRVNEWTSERVDKHSLNISNLPIRPFPSWNESFYLHKILDFAGIGKFF